MTGMSRGEQDATYANYQHIFLSSTKHFLRPNSVFLDVDIMPIKQVTRNLVSN